MLDNLLHCYAGGGSATRLERIKIEFDDYRRLQPGVAARNNRRVEFQSEHRVSLQIMPVVECVF